jgi:hypothetical protein
MSELSRRNLFACLAGLVAVAPQASNAMVEQDHPILSALARYRHFEAIVCADPIHGLIVQHRRVWSSIGSMMSARDECHSEDDDAYSAYDCAVKIAFDKAHYLVAAMAKVGATTMAGWAALLNYQAEVADLEHTFVDRLRTETLGEVIGRKFQQAQVELPGLADEGVRARALDEFFDAVASASAARGELARAVPVSAWEFGLLTSFVAEKTAELERDGYDGSFFDGQDQNAYVRTIDSAVKRLLVR